MSSIRMRARLQGERGTAAVEFALVSMVFVVLLFGMLTFGFVFAVQHNMTAAASAGARAALKAPAGTEVTVAEARAKDALSYQQLEDHATVTAQLLNGAGCEPANPNITCIEVSISFDYAAHPIIPSLFNVGAPSTMTASSKIELD